MGGFRGLTFQKSLAAFSAERVYSQAELDAAVATEREACAKLCETHAPTGLQHGLSYAAAIRARGDK